MTITHPDVKKLIASYKEIILLEYTRGLLHWDLNVNLPQKASAGRGEQVAYLTKLITEKWQDPDFRSTLESVSGRSSLTDDEKAVIRAFNHHSKYYYKVPKETIIKREQITSEAFIPWREAKEENNVKKFLPHLKKILTVTQEIAEHMEYKENPYDVMLDLHEPELTASFVKPLFEDLRDELVVLIKKITKNKGYPKEIPFINRDAHFPIPEQRRLIDYVLPRMGLDPQASRLDISPHPFTTTLDRHDIRITTKFLKHDFRDSITSTIHEAGHALYEQGIDQAYTNTPLMGGVSMGIHEAMSRFWENMIGKNPAFLQFLAPIMQTLYAKELTNTTTDDIIKAFNFVQPSFIRIEADEVTYSLHIILRFEIENELMNEKITVADAPEVWRAKFKKYFGVEPQSYSDGMLQDVHWTYGSIGYFPSYALGNLYGAQFLSVMKKEVAFDEELRKGNLLPIKDWLDKNIHTHGSRYFPKELVKKVTGKPLDYKYFVEYLNQKYGKLYNLTR